MRHLFLILNLLLVNATYAEIYKWIDENGKIRFSDKKPASAQVSIINVKQQNRSTRDEQPIQKILEQKKPLLFRYYNAALKTDPTIEGSVDFIIDIAPSGAVIKAKIISTQINDQKLLKEFLSVIKNVDFGAKDVKNAQVRWSVQFLSM
ncbi:AgmX/PglI C-terminal domain-containing protein [Microbulbifer sp. JMSA003]|uniref:AgmX/PglI C-terminal domain-containing protein n=1 Tax=Microbulbifer sp. JMSA003 TaxID=3243369 RepID=UPI00403A055B